MDLNEKLNEFYPGNIVRKDLTSKIKQALSVPTYVLEYLLGMYCSSDNEEVINSGVKKVSDIISKCIISKSESNLIKSRIREQGFYTIIDKLSIEYSERDDIYKASFENLSIEPFNVEGEMIIHNEKLFLSGVWCIIKLKFESGESEENYTDYETDFDGNHRSKIRKKNKSGHFKIESIRPIQMPTLDMEEFIRSREKFSDSEWVDVLVRSLGYESSKYSSREKMHLLLRTIPLIQKNYNLVELGPRGTGKTHVYSEVSANSLVLSAGHATVARLFYNIFRDEPGLVTTRECITFDEVGGLQTKYDEMVQIMKNYMANGSFSRGTDEIMGEASMVFIGNTNQSLAEMFKYSSLFDPFPSYFNRDAAFFDRIHAYLPGWEIPKLKESLLTKEYGLITDCFSEFCHVMRKKDFSNLIDKFFTLNSSFNKRDDIAVRRTFSGFAKLIYPSGKMSKDQVKSILDYSIEYRRRVKEQLKRMQPIEFNDTRLGYIDNEIGKEYIIEVPEELKEKVIPMEPQKPGCVYSIGKTIDNEIGSYKLENMPLNSDCGLRLGLIEGVKLSTETRKSFATAFDYFVNNYKKLINLTNENIDFNIYIEDIFSRGPSVELSVAEFIALCSAITNKSITPGLIISGRIVASGTIIPSAVSLEDIIITAIGLGAITILLPSIQKKDVMQLSSNIKNDIRIEYYDDPLEATLKALGISNG